MAVVGVVLIYLDRRDFVEDRRSELSDFEQEQLEFYRERTALLLTAATLFLGAGGALLLRSQQGSALRQSLAFATLWAAGLSLVFGYVAYDAAEWMMQVRVFNLEAREVVVPAGFQLLMLIASAAALVWDFLLGDDA